MFAGLQYLGLGRERVVRVATDTQGAIRSEDFHRALEAVSGPTIAILQAGQINSGAFDPFEEIVPVARAAGVGPRRRCVRALGASSGIPFRSDGGCGSGRLLGDRRPQVATGSV